MDFRFLLSISRVGFRHGISILQPPSDLICIKFKNSCTRVSISRVVSSKSPREANQRSGSGE